MDVAGDGQKGWLTPVRPNTLLETCCTALLERTGVQPAAVEDLVIGCSTPIGAQSRIIARNAWLQGGYPVEVPGTTIDRRCGSAQRPPSR